MKKASKVLVLILATVFVLGVFSGCAMFGKNTEKYRSQAMFTVGNETITVGKFIDTFNNYYNSYASYISAGYITTDYVMELSISSLLTQYIKVDAYKSSYTGATVAHEWADSSLHFANQEYLTVAEMQYAIRYIKYVLFSTLDSVVEGYIAKDLDITFNAAASEDTSRDFIEYDNIDASTYSEYTYKQNFVNKDMEEYFGKYYIGLITTNDINVDCYVYQSADAAKAYIDSLNERIDQEEDAQDKVVVTYDKLKECQSKALNQYKKNVIRNYGYDLNELIVKQVEDFIISVIVAKYNYGVYSQIDGDAAKLAASVEDYKNNVYAENKKNQSAGYVLKNDFVSFIEGLSATSFIYDIPDGYNYIYVKNILIPFNANQTTILTNFGKNHGSTDDEIYLAKRNEIAGNIVAECFTQKDDKGENVKSEDVFTYNASENRVEISTTGILKDYFTADASDASCGMVQAMTKDGATLSLDETIIELMAMYNTDTAQHKATYDYVVRVGEVPENYSAKWVPEFVDAANAAYDLAVSNGMEGGTYALAVSSYGVHIVYYAGMVKTQDCVVASEINFANPDFTKTAQYRMWKSYFESKSEKMLEEAANALEKGYYAGKVSATKEFKKFLKDNKLEFDFDKFVSEHK